MPAVINLKYRLNPEQQQDFLLKLERASISRPNLRRYARDNDLGDQLAYLLFLGYEAISMYQIKTPSGEIFTKRKARKMLELHLELGNQTQLDALHVLEYLAIKH